MRPDDDDFFDDFDSRNRRGFLSRFGWTRWTGERVTLGWAVLFCALGIGLGFMLGRAHPEEHYREIAAELSDARADARRARNERARANRESRSLRARAELNAGATEALAKRAAESEREKAALAERVAFYRRLFGERNPGDGELAIQALQVEPDFSPNRHHLSAVLVRNGESRKPFKGRYYFEVVATGVGGNGDGDGENGDGVDGSENGVDGSRILRVPPEGGELAFDFYLEIGERLELPPDGEIENVRLVVTDPADRRVAERTLIAPEPEN